MKTILQSAIAVSLLLAAPVRAQDVSQFAGLLAAGTEGFGQSVGEAMTAGSSVFVTATGRAELPGPIADAYLVNIEGKSASAVEAARLRDQRLQVARDAAQRFGVEVEPGSASFSREIDQEAQAKRNAERMAERAAHPGVAVPFTFDEDAPRVFVARIGVRFRTADPKRLPPFLDALTAAGVDNVSGTLGAGGLPFLHSSEVLGFGSLDRIDPALWDKASRNAVAEARRQAELLAAAGGRQLGDVKQVMLLTRSVQGGAASVTVAARFAFAK